MNNAGIGNVGKSNAGKSKLEKSNVEKSNAGKGYVNTRNGIIGRLAGRVMAVGCCFMLLAGADVMQVQAGTFAQCAGFDKSEQEDEMTALQLEIEEGAEVRLEIRDCPSVILKPVEGKEFGYQLDESLYQITAGDGSDGILIQVTGGKDGKNLEWDQMERPVIYVPEEQLGLLTVIGESSGISVAGLNVDLKLENRNGAAGICVPEDFDKSIWLDMKSGSGGVRISAKADNYVVRAAKGDIRESAFAPGKDLPAFQYGQEYSFQKGEALGSIYLKMEKSAFSIALNQEK